MVSMVGREKKESVKIGDLFFCSQLLAELNFYSSAEQDPPFKNPRSTTGMCVCLCVATIIIAHKILSYMHAPIFFFFIVYLFFFKGYLFFTPYQPILIVIS